MTNPSKRIDLWKGPGGLITAVRGVDVFNPATPEDFTFLVDCVGKEFFELLKSIRSKNTNNLSEADLDIIQEWNYTFWCTGGGKQLSRGLAESRWCPAEDVEKLAKQAMNTHREGLRHRAAEKLVAYKETQLTSSSPNSSTADSKSEPIASNSTIETISTAPIVAMALYGKSEEQGASEEPSKPSKGLTDSKWAKGGAYDIKSQGLHKEFRKFTRGFHTSSLVNTSGLKNPAPNSYNGPTFVSPKRCSAIIIKNPITEEVVDKVAWKSNSDSGTHSLSPSIPPPSKSLVQGLASVQQAPLGAQVSQPAYNVPTPSKDQAIVQQATPRAQNQQNDVAQNIQSHLPTMPGNQLLQNTRVVAQKKVNSQHSVFGDTSQDTLAKFATIVTSANTQVSRTEYVSPLFRNADGSPNQQLIDDAKKEIEQRKAAGLHRNSQPTSASPFAKEKDFLPNLRKPTVEQFLTQQSTQISRPPLTPYVPPHLRGADGLPCQELIEYDELQKRSAAGRQATISSKFPASTTQTDIKAEQVFITSCQLENQKLPVLFATHQGSWDNKNTGNSSNQLSIPQQFQAQKFPAPSSSSQAGWNIKNANTGANRTAVLQQSGTQKPIIPTASLSANWKNKNIACKTFHFLPDLQNEKQASTGADQIMAAQRQLVIDGLLQELDRPAGFWPNPWVSMKKHQLLHAPEDAQRSNIPISELLTEDALMAVYGSKPCEEYSIDYKISDDGVAKEGIRATEGAPELLDWDGKNWAPGPCDWENERPKFNNNFVPEYIREWQKELPSGSELAVDITTMQFSTAKEAINNGLYDVSIIQPDSLPDIENSSDNLKRVNQTSANEAHNYSVAFEKREQRRQKQQRIIEAQTIEIMSRAPELNPFSPKIALYMRPAEEKDAVGVAEVYNHYIKNSILTEDQEEFTAQDAFELIRAAKSQKLPFIISISGRVPSMTDVQGRRGISQRSMLPQVEKVIGFAFSERFNCSLSCKTNGRSRFTSSLQLYVHPQYMRQGVGRNLMDRLMHTMTRSYAYKNAAEWINPCNDHVNETEGSGTWHQMLINVPVQKTDEETLTWLQPWLYHQNSFWFKEHYRMKSIARSNPNNGQGPALWLDVAVFQCEATHANVFGPFE